MPTPDRAHTPNLTPSRGLNSGADPQPGAGFGHGPDRGPDHQPDHGPDHGPDSGLSSSAGSALQPAPAGDRGDNPAPDPADAHSIPALAIRGIIGGLLMGFANLVPGISGGAMLLIVGVYKRFITAVAEVTTLTFRLRSIVTLACVAMGAGTSILFLAGIVKWLIINHRWETFSIFIGLRIGAIPMVWRLCRPANTSVWIGCAAGLIVTAVAAAAQYSTGGAGLGAGSSTAMLFFAGLAGASATILPGLDGSYLLMLLGQYVVILASISRFKDGLTGGDIAAMTAELWTLVPVGIGVLLGIGGVSVLLRWLFARAPKPTAGVLLGIVVGAFIGLWPFAEYVPPAIGDVVKGVTVTAENVSSIPQEDWSLRFLIPTGGQVAGAIGLIVVGVVLAWLFSKLEPKDDAAPVLGR